MEQQPEPSPGFEQFDVRGSDFDDDIVDEFDSHLPDDPRVVDWHRVAHLTDNSALIKNRPKLKQIIHEVRYLRLERKIRKDIVHILRSSGGSVGIVELMRRIDDIDGEAAANAAIGLVYIMQAEGAVVIDNEFKMYDFMLADQHHRFVDENIVVKLLLKH